MIGVERLNVSVLLQTEKARVCHTQFLALIDIRRTLHQIQARTEHFRRTVAVFRQITAKLRHGARLIVIAPEQAVPSCAAQALLPLGKRFFERGERGSGICPFPIRPVGETGMLKVEDHVELMPVCAGVFFSFFQRNTGTFAHGHDIIVAEHLFMHFLQVLMYVRAVYAIGRQIAVGIVRKCLRLGDQTDYVHAETVNAFVEPPAHHVVNLSAQFWIAPVEIGLLL